MGHVGEFFVDFHQYLGEDSELKEGAPQFSENPDLLLGLYRNMVEARHFDQQVIALQRTGEIGTFASILGQEAVGAAIGHALKEIDIFVPYYRDTGAQRMRGVKFQEILLFWGGDERGNNFSTGLARKDFPYCVPIATQVTHAAGVAAALRIQERPGAVLVTCGDGATSRGEFLESINLAGVWKLPLVIIINNNQWAISEPVALQTRAKTLAQKAVSAGIPGEQVDGNDALALYERVRIALERAREGSGPTLIEAKTYRLGDHTTADDATRYRSSEEVDHAWKFEPIGRLRKFLEKRKLWDAEQEAGLLEVCRQSVDAAVADFQNTAQQPVTAMFDHLYQTLPRLYHEQREELINKYQAEHGKL